MQSTKNTKQFLVSGALMAVYLFWGGTYLAMKVAIESIPPFILGGLRFFTAGLCVYLLEMYRGSPRPTLAQWGSAIYVGFLLLVLSMGGLVWAEQYIPSGIASIIFAAVPLWMAVIEWLFHKKRPNGLAVVGLGLGFCGVILLVMNTASEIEFDLQKWGGYAVAGFASIAWACGSINSRTANLPDSPVLSVAMQNLAGGVGCTLISLLLGEWNSFNVGSVSSGSFLALAYLVVFGSLLGFGAYIWLLKTVNSAIVSTYAYVNPVVAVFLGWALAEEKLTLFDGAAAVVILISVSLITNNKTILGNNDGVGDAENIQSECRNSA